MKIFLFLYPIKPYIEHEVRNWFWRDKNIDPLCRLNELVEIRYRQRGYRIFWLVFSVHGHRKKIDQQLISPRIVIKEQDQIIPAGVFWHSHTCKELKKHIYPSPAHILQQLPTNTKEISIGGFHQYDCVGRVARYVYRHSIPVMVDEDLTDYYFKRMRAEKNIPDTREEYTAEAFGVLNTTDDNQYHRERIIEVRHRQPWFAQPKCL